MDKYMSIPTTRYTTADYSENLIKVKIYVMHNGTNFNGSSFSDVSIEKAKNSLKNIPILAYIKDEIDGSKDFDEHNTDIEIEFDGKDINIKETYLETPIGVIPETNSYAIETIEGKNYVVCEGYIWKNYGNEAYSILEEAGGEKKVSMEIKVNAGNLDDKGIYHIEDYTYLGVTVLGQKVPPAMGEHCRLMMQFSKNDNIEYFRAVEALNNELKCNLQGSEVQNLEVVKTIQEEAEIVVEETAVLNNEEEFADNKKKKKDTPSSDASSCDIEGDTVIEETEQPKIEQEVEEEAVEESAPLNTEEVVEEVASEEENKQEEVQQEESVEENVIENVEEIVEEVVEEAANEFSITEEEYTKLQDELTELREFKANILREERKNNIAEIVAEFNFEEEEISELVEKAINEELTLEMFKKELFALEGMKAYAKRRKFSSNTQEETVATKIVVKNSIEKEEAPYGGLFEKYGCK